MPQTYPLHRPLQDGIALAINAALGEAPVRIRLLETAEGRIWIKRVEQLSLRWRLQKGSGRRSFEKDREGLHVLGDAGLPVAPILAEGPDFFVTPDLGVTLHALLGGDAPKAERIVAFRTAGTALAALHLKGFSHGRPAVRDLCWDGTAVRFIDMEKFSVRRSKPRHFAGDVLVFVHSVFAAGGAADELEAAMAAYRAGVGAEAWSAVRGFAARLAFLGPLTVPLRTLRPRSRDLNAVANTLDYMAGRA